MKIENKFLASLLTSIGVKVVAELAIDDTNGVKLTFPDISEISEIAEGVAVDAPDDTYVIANGDKSITIVVAAGKVTEVKDTSADDAAAAAKAAAEAAKGEIDPEVKAFLTILTAEIKADKAKFTALEKDYNSLKASLKHGTEETKVEKEPIENFKIV